MRAVVYDRYGSPDVLRIEDVPVPSPARRAGAGQGRRDLAQPQRLGGPRGSPVYARIGGLRAPARRTLGSDIAGWVDAVGEGVTRFRPGDEVYGDNLQLKGGFAEYAVAPESALALKPAAADLRRGVDDPASRRDRAAGHARRGGRTSHADQRCRRGSGSFAIQLAKQLGAHVTGVDNAGKLDFMRSLGADEVIDYRTRRLHPARPVRPDPRPGRAPVGLRLPAGAGRRWPLPVRRRHRALVAAGAHGRAARWSAHRPPARRARRAGGADATSGRWPPGAQPARSTSTSTAHSTWTRSPGRWPRSAKAEPAARWSSRSRESSRGPGAPHQ